MSKLKWAGTVNGLRRGKMACAAFFLCAATAIALPAQTVTTLHNFVLGDGLSPYAGVIQATDGNFYGTTFYGGIGSACLRSCGTVFKITPSGTLTTVYTFCSQSNCADGASPYAGLVQATDGNFYGTTEFGGATNAVCTIGCGTVFKLTPSGTLTTLHAFCRETPCTDGLIPFAGLVQATDGNLYGATYAGGAEGQYGTIFKITPGGTLTTLHSFGGPDGAYPYGALVQGTDGNFYGTTNEGGRDSFCSGGCGTIFKISSGGTLTTLHSFEFLDGAGPSAGLVQATDGNFYGTTEAGGTEGFGAVFKLTSSGTLTRLYSFCSQSNCADGNYPAAGLVQGTDGNFYGTTINGGAGGNASGTIFKITSDGRLTTLHTFQGTEGADPYSGLFQATNGNFYGTTEYGGTIRICGGPCGTIFGLSVDLRPFVETQPTSGKVGASVKILGSGLIGATSVTFNGTAAAFTVVLHSLIITTVPVGATTGVVQVVTPSGTLSSNVPFRVKP